MTCTGCLPSRNMKSAMSFRLRTSTRATSWRGRPPPAYFQVHVMICLTLFALWPFTRLVHAFSAPIGYLFRPYVVYRSRDVAATDELVGLHPRRRGW